VNVAIRPAVPQDCSVLLTLIAEHARFERGVATITHLELLSILASEVPPVAILVATRDEEVLGYAAITFDFGLWRARPWAHLDCLFVREESRGLGLGAMLLGAAVDFALASGIDRVEWQTPAWNERAIAFYRRAGALDTFKVRFTLSAAREVHARANA
jgi:GNAT superfamily N-acetyltransferase